MCARRLVGLAVHTLGQGEKPGQPSMDESHSWAGMVYVEQNPVRAHLVESAEQWRWSSARAHLEDRPGDLLDFSLWRRRFTPESWREQLSLGVRDAALLERIREATRTGRPSAEEAFLRELEGQMNARLLPRKRGRPRKLPLSAISSQSETPSIGSAAAG